MTDEREWEFTDFHEPSLVGGVEIRVALDGRTAMVAWPWDLVEPARAVVRTVREMGWPVLTECGNMLPYKIDGATTDDTDYVILEAR